VEYPQYYSMNLELWQVNGDYWTIATILEYSWQLSSCYEYRLYNLIMPIVIYDYELVGCNILTSLSPQPGDKTLSNFKVLIKPFRITWTTFSPQSIRKVPISLIIWVIIIYHVAAFPNMTSLSPVSSSYLIILSKNVLPHCFSLPPNDIFLYDYKLLIIKSQSPLFPR